MKICILGCGNGGTTIAADLALKGHSVNLVKTSNIKSKHYDFMVKNNYEVIIEDNDKTSVAKLNLVTNDYEAGISGCELIILFIPTNYQEDIIKNIAPYLTNQIILIEPGYLGTFYFKKYVDSKELIFVEAESSPIDCRIIEPGKVKVFFKNVRNPIGVYPFEKSEEILKKLSVLEYNFELVDSIVESALHNPNLIVHTIGAFMSIPRIEYTKGEYWMYREVFTPSVWNIVKGLDNEKMIILEKLGYNKISYVEACRYRNSMDITIDATEIFFDYAHNSSPKGPSIPDSRYITEDVPEGLVLLESLGNALGIPTPVCTSIINLSSISLNKDFRKNGRTLQKLGIEDVNILSNKINKSL